jgi:NAD kinase
MYEDYLKNIFIVYKHDKCATCNMVCQLLKSLGYKSRKKLRDNIIESDFKKPGLVIVVGGDGTTLKVCQMIRNESIVFSVNSFPRKTEGYLTSAKPHDFMSKFKRFMRGNVKIMEFPRIKVKVNNKVLPYVAVNEVSIS